VEAEQRHQREKEISRYEREGCQCSTKMLHAMNERAQVKQGLRVLNLKIGQLCYAKQLRFQ
jgi:hypothetical protein